MRGHLFLTEAEIERGRMARKIYGSYVLIEPSPQDRKNVNRMWPIESWAEMVTLLQKSFAYPIVQFDHEHATKLPGIPALSSPTFRDACGLMHAAHLVVALEGGIPFATAALDVPTVVLWGGCVSAETLAFPEHVNVVDDDPDTPCGSLKPCAHCRKAWEQLTPEWVATVVSRSARLCPTRYLGSAVTGRIH
jgi:ADP-heptose:LPS heptosyltransferase